METYLNKSQPSFHKVKNILLRYKSFSEVRYSKEYEHPENLYLLRYFPKYYKTLKLKITKQNPLLSKIKNIKRIKKIKSVGCRFQEDLRTNWMSLFGNCRKDIEDISEIPPLKTSGKPMRFFWTKLNLQQAKFFYNIQNHLLSIGDTSGRDSGFKRSEIVVIEKAVVKYLRNIKRSRKILHIRADRYNCDELKDLLKKLEKRNDSYPMRTSLRIDLLEIKVPFCHLQHPIVFQDEARFDPRLCTILQIMSENLRSLSIDFARFFSESPEFPHFLLSLQNFSKLETLGFYFSKNMKRFLPYIKPPTNLRNLKLYFKTSSLSDQETLKGFRDTSSSKNLVKHWDDLKELENLEFFVTCKDGRNLHSLKVFVTAVLKKILKLASFTFGFNIDEDRVESFSVFEPFFAEQVPHLYDCLQNFQAELNGFAYLAGPVFDLDVLKPFKNLKKIKMLGDGICCVNMKDAIETFENHRKDGVFLKLSGKRIEIRSKNELQEILERISWATKLKRNLKISLSLKLYTVSKEHQMKELEEYWKMINSAKLKRNFILHVAFFLCSDPNIDEIREIIGKYREMPNCIFQMSGVREKLKYIKVNGGKEQLLRN